MSPINVWNQQSLWTEICMKHAYKISITLCQYTQKKNTNILVVWSTLWETIVVYGGRGCRGAIEAKVTQIMCKWLLLYSMVEYEVPSTMQASLLYLYNLTKHCRVPSVVHVAYMYYVVNKTWKNSFHNILREIVQFKKEQICMCSISTRVISFSL